MTKKTEKETTKTERKYSKTAYLDAETNSKERLLLNTLLEDGEYYSKDEVSKAIKQWKSKVIKEVKA